MLAARFIGIFAIFATIEEFLQPVDILVEKAGDRPCYRSGKSAALKSRRILLG
jgi:hypothetical protein